MQLTCAWQAVEDRLRTCAKKNTRRKLGKPGRRPAYSEQEQQFMVKVKEGRQYVLIQIITTRPVYSGFNQLGGQW